MAYDFLFIYPWCSSFPPLEPSFISLRTTMSWYPDHRAEPYGAPTTYYDQGADVSSIKSSSDDKKEYYDEGDEQPEVKLSRLDKFAGQTKGWGDLSNIEPEVVERVFDQDRVREAFTTRQLAMIALSGSVGVGIWLGVGKALAKAGPLSLLLGYLIVGVFACSMLFCQAEVRIYPLDPPWFLWGTGIDMVLSAAIELSSSIGVLRSTLWNVRLPSTSVQQWMERGVRYICRSTR